MYRTISLSLLASLLLVLLTLPQTVQAQPWGFVDVNGASVGVEGGMSFGSGTVRPGFSLGVRHAHNWMLGQPDFESFVGVAIIPTGSWLFSPNLGGGVTYNGARFEPSIRGLFIFTQTAPVAFRVALFTLWNTATNFALAKLSLGPSIRLWHTKLRIFPHLGLLVSSPGTGRSVNADTVFGVTLFF
ncbi:MAG: hypothetical protein WCV84_00245 [Patescibacteria group bacterium]